MNLYCPICKEVQYSQEGNAYMKIDGKTNDPEMMKKVMKCKCGSSLVTEEEFTNKK